MIALLSKMQASFAMSVRTLASLLVLCVLLYLFIGIPQASAQAAPLTANPDTYTTNEWGSVFGVNLLDNDSSAPGTTLTMVYDVPWQFGTNGGTFLLSPDGGFMFDPDGAFDTLPLGQTIDTTYVYTVTDGTNTASAAVTVTVNGQYVDPNPVDTDGDGVADAADNCPTVANADQADNDNDGVGNVCDSTPDGDPVPVDTDGDGVEDAVDNCPTVSNADQADNDNDGIGNVCDSTPDGDPVDTDGDGVEDAVDNCPTVANADQADNDNDGVGNVCDSTPDGDPVDTDGDGVEDAVDNCPLVANPDQADNDGDGIGNVCDSTPDGDPVPNPGIHINNYVFGHSLWWHGYAAEPDRSYIGEWLTFLAEDAGNTYTTDGQWGQPQSHLDTLPADPQWSSVNTESGWNGTFADSDYNVVVFMPSNFEQWIEPNEPYFGDTRTPVEVATELFQWVLAQEPDTEIVIYAHYPDMGPYGEPSTITPSRYLDYHNDTRGSYLEWFREYYASITANLPDANITMVEGGAIMSDVLIDLLGNQIAPSDLYEDNAPHGWPTTYFLASLVMYMHMYGEKPSATFEVPEVVVPEVRNNYNQIVDFIWDRLHSTTTTPIDTDGDGVADAADNCPTVSNADQADNDNDGVGNVCDSTPDGDPVDTDGDGVEDAVDNCPTVSNADQADNDGDGIGNVCDSTPDGDPVPVDTDGDGVEDSVDNCPTVANADQADNDGDGVGNVCDSTPDGDPVDTDGDGVEDTLDNCPTVANADQADNDGDGIGNVCDSTPDGDPQTPLTANPDTYTTNEWGSVFGVNLLDNDSSAPGTTLTMVYDVPWQFGTNGGTFLLSPDGGFMFDPDGAFDTLPLGQTIDTTYVYTVTDGTNTASAAVTVTVVGQAQ